MICNLHQVEYALEFGERIVGLSGGKVVFDGTPGPLTADVIHRIYPGLEDPGIARVLGPAPARACVQFAAARRHRGIA